MRSDYSQIAQSPKTEDDSIIAHFSDGLHINFSKGETIIDAVDETNGIYLIKSGFVKAFSVSKEGNCNLLIIHEIGEFVPLPWALNGAHTTGLFYEAMTSVSVIRSSKGKLRTALGNNPWLSQEILKQTVNIVSVYTQRIQTLEFRTARERIIAELIYLVERFGKITGKKIIINAPITHQDLADSINMSRETASRALGLLFKEGILGQDEHTFVIEDPTRLQLSRG